MWIVEALQLTVDGKPINRWRLTATSDEDGGGPFGDNSHSHDNEEDCHTCEKCDAYVSSITRLATKKSIEEAKDGAEYNEYLRLIKKFESQ